MSASTVPSNLDTSTGGTQQSGAMRPDLLDIADSPVDGEINVYSDGAVWVIDEVEMPTFQVETPVAVYTLLRDAAALVSIQDPINLKQWIGFSANRPRRGLPALGVCCETGIPSSMNLPVMITVKDEECQGRTHARLVSTSNDGDIHVVWDFFLTHVTITLKHLKAPYGFTYQGVPSGALGSEDQLRLSDGTSRRALESWYGDLPGPAEWVYLADTIDTHSVFLVSHGDDELTEAYTVPNGDSAKFVFASAESTTLPARFSVGLIGSTEHAQVAARVNFLLAATR